LLDDLQAQLVSENAATQIRILGINAAGLESGNATITAGTTIPWLQDTTAANVYGLWGGQQLHLQILDGSNVHRSTWSHISKPLAAANDANWNELKALLKSIAGE
jgi:hypothetical protein